MQVLPITNKYYTATTKTHIQAPNFKGVYINANVQKRATEELGELSGLFMTRLKEAIAKPDYFGVKIDETLDNFIQLKKHDKNVARLFLESGRRLTQRLCTYVQYDKKLNKKELKALEFVLNLKARYENQERYAFASIKLGDYFNDAPKDEIDALIDSAPKITRILKNWQTFEERKMDYESLVAMALILKNSKTFSEAEMERYLNTNLGFSPQNLQAWECGDKELRNQILLELEKASPLLQKSIEDSYEVYEIPILPSENLLKKVKLLNKEADLEGIRDILEEACYAEDLKRNLEKYKRLPSETRNAIKEEVIASLIVNFEFYRNEGKIKNPDVTADDYVKLVQLLPENKLLYQSEALLSIPHLNEEKIALLKKNISLFKNMGAPLGSLSVPLFRMFFSENYENNIVLLGKLVNKDNKEILHNVYLKTQNFNPEFYKTAEKFLNNNENLYTISTLPSFNTTYIIENLFHIAKIQALTMKNPERFMNYEEHDVPQNDVNTLKKISNLILHNRNGYMEQEQNIPPSVETEFYELYNLFEDDELLNMYSAVANTDAEYINMLMSRRVGQAQDAFKTLAEWDYDTGTTVSYLLQKGRTLDNHNIPIKLSGKQKNFLVENIPNMRTSLKAKFNEILKQNQTPLDNGNFILAYNSFLNDYGSTLLTELGINPNSKLAQKWDKRFLHLVLTPNCGDKGELKLVFDLLSQGALEHYIHNPFTPHGKSNLKTKRDFENLNLDYNTWLKGIPPKDIKIGKKQYIIGLVDKNEPNSLFLGNYTNCCTGIGKLYGDSTPNYLLNTTFNIIGIKNNDGDIAGMTRIFINNSNGKPELIIDNTEFDNILLNQNCKEIEKHILEYIREFANNLTKDNLPILISLEVFKIAPKGRLIEKTVKPIGEITKKSLYINCVHKIADTKIPYNVELKQLDI